MSKNSELKNGCRGVTWRCDKTTNTCYAVVGKSPSIWSRKMLRVECYTPKNCQMEVFNGRFIIKRERNVPGMKIAKNLACEAAKR